MLPELYQPFLKVLHEVLARICLFNQLAVAAVIDPPEQAAPGVGACTLKQTEPVLFEPPKVPIGKTGTFPVMVAELQAELPIE